MNYFDTAAFGFSQAYQAQLAAADAQRRANQASDTAFADMSADNETFLRGQPQPQAPTTPNTNLNGFSETDLTENTNRDLQTLMRAKRRVSKYLSQDEVV